MYDKEKGFIFPLTEERQRQIDKLQEYNYQTSMWVNVMMAKNYKKEEGLRTKTRGFKVIFRLKLFKRYLQSITITNYYSGIFQKIGDDNIVDAALYLLYDSIENHKIMRGLVDEN